MQDYEVLCLSCLDQGCMIEKDHLSCRTMKVWSKGRFTLSTSRVWNRVVVSFCAKMSFQGGERSRQNRPPFDSIIYSQTLDSGVQFGMPARDIFVLRTVHENRRFQMTERLLPTTHHKQHKEIRSDSVWVYNRHSTGIDSLRLCLGLQETQHWNTSRRVVCTAATNFESMRRPSKPFVTPC